jgi:pimeloyl-ACP methyl ester carboxylesterase
VEYRLSGADTSPALLYFHGSPGARTEVGDYEPGLLEELGICAVSADRPGFGGTDPLDGLDLLARTGDAVAVAGQLGIHEDFYTAEHRKVFAIMENPGLAKSC